MQISDENLRGLAVVAADGHAEVPFVADLHRVVVVSAIGFRRILCAHEG